MVLKKVKLKDLPSMADSLVSSLVNSKSRKSTIIHLKGDLGSGKTTFVKHVGESLQIKSHIQSPTFTIMREYKLDGSRYDNMIHIDAYRFESKDESLVLDIDSIIKGNNLIFIEWPDRMIMTKADIILSITRNEDETRDFLVE
jgi:tRNA threonylcarbamoyladenosine biosynthesis protein TsaE